MNYKGKRGIPRTRSAQTRSSKSGSESSQPQFLEDTFATLQFPGGRRLRDDIYNETDTSSTGSNTNWRQSQILQHNKVERGTASNGTNSKSWRHPRIPQQNNVGKGFTGNFSHSGSGSYKLAEIQKRFDNLHLKNLNMDHINRRADHRSRSDSYRGSETTENNWKNNSIQKSNRGSGPRMGFRLLEDLLSKDSEQIIMDLMNSKRGFLEFIQKGLTPDAIVLFTKVLAKIATSEFVDVKYQVLQIYLEDEFSNILIDYIVRIQLQNNEDKRNNRYFWKDTDEFWTSIILISKDIVRTLPSFAVKILPKLLKSLLVCVKTFEEFHQRHISDEIIDNIKNIYTAVETLVVEEEERQKKHAQKKLNFEDDEGEPPDDFRNMSVYPNSIELTTKTAFVRKNIVRGPYKDVNHYLDIQFRLLREDFIGPLRSAIMEYLSAKNKRLENIKIHKKVQFLNSETINESYCVRLRFDFTDKKRKFSYENSKRFLFGALLVFTYDNFKTFIFGKVVDRKAELLEKGELIVGFDEQKNIHYNIDYVMVEYNVYFEPYFHVLNCLQSMNVDTFPMTKYIIEANGCISPPEYLTPNITYKVGNHNIIPLANWPQYVFYGFNEAQNEAFKAALTQEFIIIQGPPGTGKTYLGLKIARTLLRNCHVWFRHTPILLICYTNHALDQFLEGVSEFTDKIMRIGGQSKNEKLQPFNLRNQRTFKQSAATMQQRSLVKRVLDKIGRITEILKQINSYNSVVSFDVFQDVVPNYDRTWFCRAKPQDILDWLLDGNEDVGSTSNRNLNLFGNTKVIRENRENNVNMEETVSDNEGVDNDNNSNHEDVIDDLFDSPITLDINCYNSLINLKQMTAEINLSEAALRALVAIEEPTFENMLDADRNVLELQTLKRNYLYLSMRLKEGQQKQIHQEPDYVDLQNPRKMKTIDRWALYYYWLYLYKNQLVHQKDEYEVEFKKIHKVYEEMRSIEDTNMMKQVLVIGMTTTGAARLRSSLRTLRSPVVIVEEAAEVLEAHIVTSLTEHCKHLILIGDHQQLKPSTANYEIENFFNLGISLFERMVLNNIHLYSLQIQHRMKPEIARLISPHIYPDLKNHESVLHRPKISGIDKCLYFIDHKIPEANTEGTSKKNYHESKFLINFAKHLIHNGYAPEDITILAAYLGQMFEMQKERSRHQLLQGVRISVLDNYQGEESNIILLSLVRNNSENKIGFLSIENRVCVALSRARDGLYIMGNMDQLCYQNELWRKIRQTLEEQNAIGEGLELRCQVHRDITTVVKSGEDFLNISEGGCNKICEADLICGHKCKSLCHIQNRDHVKHRCQEICGKLLCESNPTHICRKMCFEECGQCTYVVSRDLTCGHNVRIECHIDTDTYMCTLPVLTTLPCSHNANKPCHADPVTFRCPHPCESRVEPCGHACKKTCHIRFDPDHLEYKCTQQCARYRKGCTVETAQHICQKQCYEECGDCLIPVKKRRTVCPHVYEVSCSANVDDILCAKPCVKILSCGHKCTNKCCEDCVEQCQARVEKTVSLCGHKLKVKCCEEPDRKNCIRKCPLKLPCGHSCTTTCNLPCTKNCKELVDCNIESVCGHFVKKVHCYVLSNQADSKTVTKYCTALCDATLKCKHKCSGTCGECSQGRVHKRCAESCGVPLVCDHLCKFPCRESCRPCNENCPLRCVHSVCKKKCGEVCTPCKENCSRRCKHQTCSNPCGLICNVLPCEQPCLKLLKCGHQCIGFCGEPCPPKCLVCDKEELTTIEFGFEAEDARYVLLNDCKHVIENTALEQWLKIDDGNIGFKLCPRCKTCIKTTTRFSDYTKKSMNDVSKVKLALHGAEAENLAKRQQLNLMMLELEESSTHLQLRCPLFAKLLSTIEVRLRPTKKTKRQPINQHELNALETKIDILKIITNVCTQKNVVITSTTTFLPQVMFIAKILLRDENYITDQEIEDIELELDRLSKMITFDRLKTSPNFAYNFSTNSTVIKEVHHIEELLFSLNKFCKDIGAQVTAKLTQLNKLLASNIGITEEERKMVHRVMGFAKGHWFKCPNGHIYCIGECGGAMEVSICPECKEKIGGTSHSLLQGNIVATEMDGARFGAWSEQANMGNYEL